MICFSNLTKYKKKFKILKTKKMNLF